jgi:hypothetical protein
MPEVMLLALTGLGCLLDLGKLIRFLNPFLRHDFFVFWSPNFNSKLGLGCDR